MTRRERIHRRLEEGLRPDHLEVIDESHMHSVPKGAETHFKVVVASTSFAGKSRVDRHRTVNRLLSEELASGLHALALSAFTDEEWRASPGAMESPPCLGGSKADRPA